MGIFEARELKKVVFYVKNLFVVRNG